MSARLPITSCRRAKSRGYEFGKADAYDWIAKGASVKAIAKAGRAGGVEKATALANAQAAAAAAGASPKWVKPFARAYMAAWRTVCSTYISVRRSVREASAMVEAEAQ